MIMDDENSVIYKVETIAANATDTSNIHAQTQGSGDEQSDFQADGSNRQYFSDKEHIVNQT